MFDPAALGTLRIGLDANEPEAGSRRPSTQAQPRTAVRSTIAGTLRRLAAALEPAAVREPAA